MAQHRTLLWEMKHPFKKKKKKAVALEALLNSFPLAILSDKTSRQGALGIWMTWWPSVLQGGHHLPST